MVFLFVTHIVVADILIRSNVFHLLTKSLGMQYSVVTTNEGHSTELVNVSCCLICDCLKLNMHFNET